MRQVLTAGISLFCLLLPSVALGQAIYHPEAGYPLDARHFTPEEYGAFMQNWDVVQDGRGLIYVANNYGILEHDGVSWRLIPTRNGMFVRALARDAAGTVYVGMQGDFGYLKPDASGELRYESLTGFLDADTRDFKDIWSVHATEDGVYFQARQWLFRWDGEKLKTWRSSGAFHTAFALRGNYYVREHGRGLLHVEGDSLSMVTGGEYFRELPLYTMLPLSGGRVLIGTRKEGFLIYDHGVISHLPTEADHLLEQYNLYSGTVLPDGSFALATLGAGVLVINEKGQLMRSYNEAVGMPDLWINAVYVDNQNDLWMALNTGGVMRVEAVPQVTVLDDRIGSEGFIYEIIRHKGRLHVWTSAGIFALRAQEGGNAGTPKLPSFEPIGRIEMVRSLLSEGDHLLVSTEKGIYTLQQGELVPLFSEWRGNVFQTIPSYAFSGRFYAGTKDGLVVFHRTSSGWTEPENVPGVDEEIRGVLENSDGSLWLATMSGDILHIRMSVHRGGMPQIRRYSRADGLPGELMTPLRTVAGVRFSSRLGVFKMRLPSEREDNALLFELDSHIHPAHGAQPDTIRISQIDSHGNLWLGYSDRIESVALDSDGSARVTTPDALRFKTGSYFDIYAEPNGVVWVSDGEKILRYDSRVLSPPNVPYAAFVRRVMPVDTDSVIFGGAFAGENGQLSHSQHASHLPVLPYESGDLEIEFAAPVFDHSGATEYRYYLEGRDQEWGAWSPRTKAAYTNLREGTHTFRVQARNAQGYLSSVGTFSFKILPPWYRTWWAYAIYAGLAVAVGMAALHYRITIIENRKAREQAIQLARERIANERLQQANARLQEANDRLHEADRIKDEFLTNTSHELRTPITAILGFTSVLREEVPDEFHEFLGIIEENGKRLLHTVNSLLDMAKLKAGAVDLKQDVVDVARQCGEVIKFLSPLAERKGLWLELDQPEEPVYARLDPPSFERVLHNLIGNAIKFTEEGGVTVRIDQAEDRVRIQVIDTGIGIEEEFLPYLFQEFRQASTGLSRSHEGSGLGLAISARLVNLMDGDIHVESRAGSGSTFSIRLPQVAEEEQPVEQIHFQ